ncbi:alanine racemase [Caulobacter sp. KR2-114]|uniref:alanine racemase n=1 Tax=Caulobacter sp. KR2-114 TaxID=3400912 RepID=UPI003C080B89
MSAARLTIDLAALAANHATLKAAAPGAVVAPVVKADGYGLGAGLIAGRLWDEGARDLFVARLSEGQALRAALGGGRPARIFILDGLAGADAGALADADLTPVLNTPEDIARWRPQRRPCGLHIDTGMNRLGLDVDDARAAADLDVALVMSHLACAAESSSPRNARQLALFRQARARFPDAPASLAASAGVYLGAGYHFDMVRPGISLYGGGPQEVADDRFAAVATLEAPILQARELQAGDAVGYGDGFVADRAMRVGLLAAGYADGLLRRSMGRATAWIGDAPAPILTVSMDLLAVDLSQAPRAKAGDLVQLLGPRARLDDLAAATGTVAHECLVRLSARAERVGRG